MSTTTTTGGNFGTVQKVIYFGTLFVALLFLIIGLATLEWRVNESGGVKVSIGLKKVRVSSGGSSQTSDITSDSDDGKAYLAGANTALAFGILAIFCLVANMIIGALINKFQEITGGKSRMIVLICSIAAGVLIILGTIIYAAQLPSSIKDGSDYGFSFVLYILSGLFSLGVAVFVFVQKEIF